MVANESDIDDIASETFAVCWKSIDKLEKHDNPRRWLAATAKNKVKHYYRGLSKQERIKDAVKNHSPPNSGKSNFSFLSRLKPKDREIIIMFYEDKLSLAQIGQKLGIKESAAKMRLSRARDRFVKIYSKKSF
jgi:RNA polymerase sigma-70 factor (ECF subfamily)